MQKERNYQLSEKILILADFSEGNWKAIQFAMEHLYQEGSEICIVQTWQKSNFGFAMVRDLGPILQNIAVSELGGMKTKLLKNYKIQESQVKLFPFEGDLSSFFTSKLYLNQKWQVVMAPSEKTCNLTNNPRIAEIIDEIKQPLYILTGIKENTEIDDVIVFSSTKKPSNLIQSCLAKIALQKKIVFRVYLDTSTYSLSIIEACKRLFSKICKRSDLQFYESDNGYSQQSLENLPPEKGQRVLIFDENYQRKYNTKLKSYLDLWLVKSKGICVGNF